MPRIQAGGALASGAAFAGWHSWMSGKGTAFAEFGLRVDIGDEDADPAEAHQRESWFMFQRFAALLAGVLRGSMVVPDVASRAELETFLSSSDYHPFVVFMYRGSFASGTCSYAWLVLRDPSFLGSSAHQLFARWTDPTAGGTAQEVPLLYADPGTEAASSGLPYRVPTYDANAEIDLGSWLEFPLVEADGPVLLFSDAEIEWLVTPASTSGT